MDTCYRTSADSLFTATPTLLQQLEDESFTATYLVSSPQRGGADSFRFTSESRVVGRPLDEEPHTNSRQDR